MSMLLRFISPMVGKPQLRLLTPMQPPVLQKTQPMHKSERRIHTLLVTLSMIHPSGLGTVSWSWFYDEWIKHMLQLKNVLFFPDPGIS